MTKQDKKLNTVTLSGLIIGPILGSGIILLPPLIYTMMGSYSLVIWATILIVGFAFALVFGKLSILYPGDGGVSLATKAAMGKKYQLLTSFYLIAAMFFGPVAVLLIAANFVQEYFPNVPIVILGFFIYLITYATLLIKIDFLGKLMLIATSAITIIFLISSINVLLHVNHFSLTLPAMQFKEIGYSFLIVFWAIIGWEVIGNYSNEVKNTKTLSQSVIFSAIIVSLVYFLLALAICFGEFENKATEAFKLVWLLEPIFKSYSNIIISSISVILCTGTLILFVGGIARLTSSLNFTKYTSKHLKNGTPFGAINFLSSIYIITLLLVYLNVLNLTNLVAFSNGFFIANAIIGLITAIILFENGFLKYCSILLAALFFIILLFSNIFILMTITILFIFTYFRTIDDKKSF